MRRSGQRDVKKKKKAKTPGKQGKKGIRKGIKARRGCIHALV